MICKYCGLEIGQSNPEECLKKPSGSKSALSAGLGVKPIEREFQSFNLREKYSGFFLGTIKVLSKTDVVETASRLKDYVARRYDKAITANYILNA